MMKKTLIVLIILAIAFMGIFIILKNTVYAEEYSSEVIDNRTESKLIKIKDEQAKSLEEYKERYGSDAYGFTAYILHGVQVYSIPICFIAIAISAIYRFVMGTRHMGNVEKGLGLMVTFVTLAIICQVLPLVFAIVVKFGKE